MTDIVERLRALDGIWHAGIWGEAADEIERLDSAYYQLRETYLQAADEIRRLRAALQWIANICPATAEHTLAHEMADAAIAALGKAA